LGLENVTGRLAGVHRNLVAELRFHCRKSVGHLKPKLHNLRLDAGQTPLDAAHPLAKLAHLGRQRHQSSGQILEIGSTP
jgi:hypothetical protein